MPKLLKKSSLFILSLSYYLSSAPPAHAQTFKWVKSCKGELEGVEFATLQGFECILANIFRIITPLAGFAAFITLIIGGFQYLTSAGDPKQAQKAQSIITGAIIGLVVVMAVWFIFKLLKTLTGLDFFYFAIPGP
jgi:amino acid transporter